MVKSHRDGRHFETGAFKNPRKKRSPECLCGGLHYLERRGKVRIERVMI